MAEGRGNVVTGPLDGLLLESSAPAAEQRPSHEDLLRDAYQVSGRRRQSPPVDAIVVPAGRPAANLNRIARLASHAGSMLLVMASRECQIEEAAHVVGTVPGCRALVVHVPETYAHPLLEFHTSEPRFLGLSAGRRSDLSRKRNLGLLLARLSGWRKIMFLDDDIFGVSGSDVARVSSELDRYPVAGLVAENFPDNSVVCHANRLSGHPQGNFITGGALGVNTADLPLDFFPSIYNEDWFFLAQRASTDGVSRAGTARQKLFNPFERPERAAEEEFGDLLAEGLYAAISGRTPVSVPSASYWSRFIDARLRLIQRITAELERSGHKSAGKAKASLHQAEKQLTIITSDNCVDFLEAWQADRHRFATRSSRLPIGVGATASLESMGLDQWIAINAGAERRLAPAV